MVCVCFFFFKQKTAYDMRISDWSSDVCSSDLVDISRLMQAAVDAGTSAPDSDDSVVISGESKLLDIFEIASDMDRLRGMLALFETKTDLLQLLDVSSRAQGVQIYIGGDSQLVPLDDEIGGASCRVRVWQ